MMFIFHNVLSHMLSLMQQGVTRRRKDEGNSPPVDRFGRVRQAAYLAGLTILLICTVSSAIGQDNSWSSPDAVFQTEGWTFHVAATKDASERIVAIWQYNPYKKTGPDASLSDNNNDSLFVSKYDGSTWSDPVEVVLGRIASEKLAVITDDGGRLHIFSQSDCLWHASAELDEIDHVPAWTTSECISDGAYTWPTATKSTDGRLNLILSSRDARQFYLMFSDDDGETWSSPQLVLQSPDQTTGLVAPALAEDIDGVLHLVWGEVELPQGTPQKTLKYARSSDRGVTWSEAFQLAGEFQSQPTIAADDQGRVHVLWNGSAADHGRYYISSVDGGLTWNSVEELYRNRGGLQMPPGLAVDSTGVVHAVFTDQERLVYRKRAEDGWSPATQLVEPKDVAHLPGGGEIDSVNLLVSNGNELHTVYSRFDLGQILHQTRFIDAPRQVRPLVTSPVESPQAQIEPAETILETSSSTDQAVKQDESIEVGWSRTQPTTSTSFSQPLLLATMLSLLTVGVVVLLRVMKRR